MISLQVPTLKKGHVRPQQEGNHKRGRRRALIRSQTSLIFDLGIVASRIVRKLISVIKAPNLWSLLWQLEWLIHYSNTLLRILLNAHVLQSLSIFTPDDVNRNSFQLCVASENSDLSLFFCSLNTCQRLKKITLAFQSFLSL